uniref:Uncharacterized protein n=1 Tax=Anguilla anguilla TaxID=7936 RepID=A0A0E9S5B8_ANGAN
MEIALGKFYVHQTELAAVTMWAPQVKSSEFGTIKH